MFEDSVTRVPVPPLRPGDIVVMDDLSAHKGPAVERSVRAAGAEVWYLPPYSPDFNPIEKMFSKLETLLCGIAARSVSELYDAMGDALRAVSAQDIAGWLRSCGSSTTMRQPL